MDAVSPLPFPLQGLPSTPAGGSARNARSLDAAAQNFESTFLSLLLKEMRQALEPGGLFADDKADIHGGLFDFFLGEHLAKAGGFGLARMLKRQLENTARHESPRTANRPAS